ncbi:MAG: hypothetical protein COU69_01150 [Candidatus Pacebacteria bacterium CG10_big_fil_rev_8_21_14_0_10_56_10]|nr:MAG: hypothetical protein COU69_01150 [Candidatus Pacebacteria bacterium CG10_big_fil_rev_8_21_14_0_10_56_10]
MKLTSPLAVANWKSHKTQRDVSRWLTAFGNAQPLPELAGTVVICPPAPFLELVARAVSGWPNVTTGIQDVSPFPMGSYTGAVAAASLAGLGVEYALVGHSERRRYFAESHQDVANKVAQCLEAELTPIVCVDDDYVTQQAAAIAPDHLEKLIVAYEALESIGTGVNQPVEVVQRMVTEIQNRFGPVPVIYGGSVDVDNADDYRQVCSGVLVGGASLDPAEFSSLL